MFDYKQYKINFKRGSVILAGSGPGDEELITIKLNNALLEADVVIYDALVNKRILEKCKSSVKLIFAGKLKGTKACSQNDINEWMVLYAKKGKKVLRLKGGDPSFFSRIAQEAFFLRKKRIDYLVFSGISSSQISIQKVNNHFFKKNSICNFITGHKRFDNFKNDIDYKRILANNGKIIIYMGVTQIQNIKRKLIKAGCNKTRKVNIICNASLSSERIFKTNLEDIIGTIKKENIIPPAIIIID